MCVSWGVDRGMEAMERVAKMQGTNVPFVTGTNVPTGIQKYPSQRVHLSP